MKSSLVVALVLAVTWAAFTPRAHAGDGDKPSLFLPQMRYDFGRLFEQEKYIHDFVVKNRGTADLVIQNVKPGCGCTVAKFDKVIPPGGEGTINLELAGNQVHGEFEKSATVYSNDPDLPVTTLTIGGTEIPYLDITPEGRVYLQGRYGEKITREFTVRSNEEMKGFEVTGVRTTMADKVTCTFRPGEDGAYIVTVEKNPELPAGAAHGSLTILTNSANAPEEELQLQVVTKGSITVSPTTLNYGAVAFGDEGKAAETVTKKVTLIRTDGGLSIADVEVDSDMYKVKVNEVVPGKKYELDVTFHPPVKKEPRQREVAEMTVHTADPTEPTVTVKLVARAK